ncbi:MAG: hypothetical protein WB681_08480 [Candidatus Cybelea sp.]
MKIAIMWLPTLTISPGARNFFENLGQFDFDGLPTDAGIYVFGRQHGAKIDPIYVGKAENLRSRIKGQRNNLRLMHALNESKSGKRILLIGTVKPSQNQTLAKILPIAERAHIRAALAAGCALVNKQGTKTKTHVIETVGRRSRNLPFERHILASQ